MARRGVWRVVLFVLAACAVGWGVYLSHPLLRAPVVAITTAEKSVHHGHYVRQDEDGRIVGTDIDLARDIAARLGRRLEIRSVPFAELLDRLEAGEADFAVGFLSITPDRRRRFDVSDPYDTQGQAFMYMAGRPMPTLATARQFRIGVQEGSTGAAELRARDVPVKAFPTYSEGRRALTEGRVDTLFYDYLPLKSFAAGSGGALRVGMFESYEEYAVMVRKGLPDVLAAANAAVAARHRTVAWFGHLLFYLLAPVAGGGLVALAFLVLVRMLRRRRPGQVADLWSLRLFSYLLVVVGSLLLAFLVAAAVLWCHALLQKAREQARADVEDCRFRLERYLGTFRDLAAHGRDSLAWFGRRGASAAEVNHLLAELSREPCTRYPEFTGFYGVYRGTFVTSDYDGVGINWIPPADYDPLTREWYRVAKESPGAIVSLPPYRDVATKQTVLTYATMLTNGVDCVGVDVILQGLERVVATADDTGETYVYSSRGDVFVHPRYHVGENMLSAADGSEDRAFFLRAAAAATGTGSFVFDVQPSGRMVAFVRRSEDGFIVVRAFRQDLLLNRYLWRFSLVCLVGVSLVSLVSTLAVLLGRGMARFNRELLATKNRELAGMRQAEAARSYFFSTVSHDIRTPLNAILGYTELLKLGIEDPVRRDEALDAVVASGNALKELINDVLDLSKLESGKMEIAPEPTDVVQLVQETVGGFRLACERKGLKLLSETSDLPRLSLDPRRIRQILFNLLGNAVKFTAEGSVSVRASWTDGTFALAVSDTGRGIAPENLERLMRPYERVQSASREEGTGLGLAICRQLAERMGGRLEVASELGRGTTFTLTVPDVASVAPASEPPAVPAPASVAQSASEGPRRVLIVDDSPVNLMVLAALLKRLGVPEIVRAESGRQALDLYLECPADLVLSDLWMPEMDGAAFVAELRREESARGLPHVPAWVVTADVEAVKNAAELGVTGVALKPLSLETLGEILLACERMMAGADRAPQHERET